MRRIILLLVCVLLLAAVPAQAEKLDDFTVKTLDGSFTLSEALAEKKAAFILFFATWCGPCRAELPCVATAYDAFRDDVAVIALTVEANDSEAKLRDFCDELGLTFPVGSALGLDVTQRYYSGSVPAMVVVDRFGDVVYTGVGSRPSVEAFTDFFAYLSDDSYTGGRMLPDFPAGRCPLTGPSAETLAKSLNAPGTSLTWHNPESPYDWPMKETEIDDLSCLASTNSAPGTRSVVSTSLHAQDGDVLAFDVRTHSSSGINLLQVSLDGECIKSFGGDTPWKTYAIALEEGEHSLSFSFVISMQGDSDYGAVRQVRTLQGEEALSAMHSLPVPPSASAITFSSPGLTVLSLTDPANVLPLLFGDTVFCMAQEGKLSVDFTLSPDLDPASALIYLPDENVLCAAGDFLHEDGYRLDMTGDQLDLYNTVLDGLQGTVRKRLLLFRGNGELQDFLQMLAQYGYNVTLSE